MGNALMVPARAIAAVVNRELTKMFRQRGRLISALVRPLMWLLLIGTGFEAMLSSTHPGSDYKSFMVPGVLGMSMLFGALLSALALVYDKEMGIMRMLLIGPFARYWIVIAKIVSATIASLVQVSLLLVLLGALGFLSWSINWPLLLVGVLLTSLACATIGMLIAAWSPTMDNFAAIMNFVIFPVYFLSGSLYPIAKLPLLLKTVALVNPYTYGVDLLKHAILPATAAKFGADLALAWDVVYLSAFVILATWLAAWRFSHEDVHAPLATGSADAS